MLEIKEVKIENILKISNLGLLICALGYENRASFFAKLICQNVINIKCKICVLLVEDYNQNEYKSFSDLGFKFINQNELHSFIIEYSETENLVDYSVMMKALYSKIIKQINKPEFENKNFIFSYTPAKFENTESGHKNVAEIYPIFFKDNFIIHNNIENILILSLGYERNSAIGIVENLEISYNNVFVLINKDSENSEHYLKCIEHNEDFLELFPKKNIFEINFFNLNEVLSYMNSIILSESNKSKQIIIAPLGVKTFSLLSMVLCNHYNNVIFYNVTSNSNKNYNKNPDVDKELYIYKMTFTSN
jgi:hypothetical protein